MPTNPELGMRLVKCNAIHDQAAYIPDLFYKILPIPQSLLMKALIPGCSDSDHQRRWSRYEVLGYLRCAIIKLALLQSPLSFPEISLQLAAGCKQRTEKN